MRVSIAIPTRDQVRDEVRTRIEKAARRFEQAGGAVEWDVVSGLPVAAARTALAQNALRRRRDAIFFVDDDTLLEEDALVKLAAHGDPFVTGVVFRRLPDEDNHACIGWQRERLGGLWQYSDDWRWPDYFEVDVCGLAAALIRTEVFERIARTGEKWFSFHWFFEHQGMSGCKSLIPQGEDIYLCLAAKRANFRIMCDSSVRCAHMDLATGKVYPSPAKWEEFRRGRAPGRAREVPNLAAIAGSAQRAIAAEARP